MKELSIEEKAKAYDNALEIAKGLYAKDAPDSLHLERMFPALKESEDEKIRNAIRTIILSSDTKQCQIVGVSQSDMFAWLKKQGEQEQLYIRFGEIPTDEKSKIFRGETEVGTENGVSVYPAFKTSEGDIVLGLNLPITKTTLYTQQHLLEYDDRPCYLVKGNYVGKDTDGQPLINNVSIIEKIDTYRAKEKKQGEQKPTIIPKFKVGDKIWHRTYKGECIHHIIRIENDNYIGHDNTSISISTADKEYELVEKQGEQKQTAEEVLIKAGLKPYKDGDQWCVLLGDNIQEGICGFGNTIEDALYAFLKDLIASQGERKPVDWSEEDRKMMRNIIDDIHCGTNFNPKVMHAANEREKWFKSICMRYQSKWKPSESQMKWLHDAIESTQYEPRKQALISLYSNLMELKV